MEVKSNIKFGESDLTLKTGVVARQATGSVIADLDGTVVLVTVVGKEDKEDEFRDFFPLRVDYIEKAYANGKIPGGFYKREGRPSEREILTARLIDRPIRPLFPKKFCSEVQIVATTISINPSVEPDIVALIGASAALAISGIPFNGPLAASRVGYKDGRYILNPTVKELATSELDLVVAGTKDSVLMVESEAKILSEEIMLEAVMFGHRAFQSVINAIEDLKKRVGKASWDWVEKEDPHDLIEKMNGKYGEKIVNAYKIIDKLERKEFLSKLKEEAILEFLSAEKCNCGCGCSKDVKDRDSSDSNDNSDSSMNENLESDLKAEDNREVDGSDINEHKILSAFEKIESSIVRKNVLAGKRIDGRDLKTVRPINVDIDLLKYVHGSSLFTRGETQSLAAVTLGTQKDAQINDSLSGEIRETFMLHYNFPPYSVNEIGMIGSPKRREIGHGKLAKRGINAVIPDYKDFPYVVRVVSEITESNGSSSMASVCSSSLALMAAGVPVSAPVSGIAMGLIKEGDQFVVISDILGDEDYLGDMDFKVAGTKEGITALQMDIKIPGITKEIMEKALAQAKEGRLHILEVMNEKISEARSEVSKTAPCISTFKINPEKIKDVIGKGGATIKSLIEETNSVIDIDDTGTIQVSGKSKDLVEAAKKKIELLIADAEIGGIYEGTVIKILDFGAFVNILPGKDGLLHISQISEQRTNKVSDVLNVGDKVKVKVLDIDRQGRINLTKKGVE